MTVPCSSSIELFHPDSSGLSQSLFYHFPKTNFKGELSPQKNFVSSVQREPLCFCILFPRSISLFLQAELTRYAKNALRLHDMPESIFHKTYFQVQSLFHPCKKSLHSRFFANIIETACLTAGFCPGCTDVPSMEYQSVAEIAALLRRHKLPQCHFHPYGSPGGYSVCPSQWQAFRTHPP